MCHMLSFFLWSTGPVFVTSSELRRLEMPSNRIIDQLPDSTIVLDCEVANSQLLTPAEIGLL